MEIFYKNNDPIIYFPSLLYVTALILVLAYNTSLLLAIILYGIPAFGSIVVLLFTRHVIYRKYLTAPDLVLSERLLRIKQPLGYYADYYLADFESVKSNGKQLTIRFFGQDTNQHMQKAVIDLGRIPSDIAANLERLIVEKARTSRKASGTVVSFQGTLATIDLNVLNDRSIGFVIDRLNYLNKQIVIDRYCIKHPAGVVECTELNAEALEALLDKKSQYKHNQPQGEANE